MSLPIDTKIARLGRAGSDRAINKSSVRIPKAAEIVAAKLRRTIVDGSIEPGSFLPSEAQMIKLFEVSRPTIREAIRILEFENLICVSRGARGGAVVQPPSPDFVSKAVGVSLQSSNATLDDVFAARAVLEPAAASMAAKTRSKEAGEKLLEHVELEFAALDDQTHTIAVEVAAFHRLLLSECGNKTFALLGVALHDLVLRHLKLYHQTVPREVSEKRARSITGIRSHEKLANLILNGQAEEAEAHWRVHMAKVAEFILPGLGKTSVLEVLDDASWT